jgi:hypothetical protein
LEAGQSVYMPPKFGRIAGWIGIVERDLVVNERR